MLEAVLLKLVVGLEDAPHGEDVTTGKVEDARLAEAPPVRVLVAKLARVEALDATELGDEVPLCRDGKGVSGLVRRVERERRRAKRTKSSLGTLEEVAPGAMMDLEAGDTLWVPLHAELVEEELDEVALGLDDVDVAPVVEPLVLLAVADDDVADMRLLIAAVPVLVLALVVRLEAEDEELDRVVLRVRQELAARVDY